MKWAAILTSWALAALVLYLVIGPPERIDERARVTIENTVAHHLRILQTAYDLPRTPAPTVVIGTDSMTAAAETLCQHASVVKGIPYWTVFVHEEMAAKHWDTFMRQTIPHEVAHLVRCLQSENWTEHDAAWENIVLSMGAEPKITHNYVGGPR